MRRATPLSLWLPLLTADFFRILLSALCWISHSSLAVKILFSQFCIWEKWGAESWYKDHITNKCKTVLLTLTWDWTIKHTQIAIHHKHEQFKTFKNGLGKVRDSYHVAVLRMNNCLPLSTKMAYSSSWWYSCPYLYTARVLGFGTGASDSHFNSVTGTGFVYVFSCSCYHQCQGDRFIWCHSLFSLQPLSQ